MSAFISIVVLLLVFIVVYSFDKNFNSPRILLLVSFLFSMSLVFLNLDNWEVKLTNTFFVYTSIAILSFFIGCSFVKVVCNQKTQYAKISPRNLVRYSAHYPYTLMALLAFFCTAVYAVTMYKSAGFNGSITSLFRSIYTNAVNGESGGFFAHQMVEIVVAISKINMFKIFVDKYILNKKIRIVSYYPIICLLLSILFSTDRNIFIRFIIYSLSLWMMFYLYTSKSSTLKTNWKILRKAVVYVLVFLVVFYWLGKIKNYTSNFERMIGLYGGSGIYNFNLYLNEFDSSKLMYGADTFSQLISTIKRFGFMGGGTSEIIHGELIAFTASNGYVYASNIYSALRPYLNDFGFFGMIIYPLILGLLFQMLFEKTKRGCGFSWIFYALMIYPLIYFAIQEQFFKRFHLGMVYEIFWVTFFYYVIFGKDGLWKIHIHY